MYNFYSNYHSAFPFLEAEELFNYRKKALIPDKDVCFQEFIKNYNGFVFATFVNQTFIGIIYFHDFSKQNEKFVSCCLSGFAKPKQALYTPVAIRKAAKYICNFYDLEKIFSYPANKAAKICILRAGFSYQNNILTLNRKDL